MGDSIAENIAFIRNDKSGFYLLCSSLLRGLHCKRIRVSSLRKINWACLRVQHHLPPHTESFVLELIIDCDLSVDDGWGGDGRQTAAVRIVHVNTWSITTHVVLNLRLTWKYSSWRLVYDGLNRFLPTFVGLCGSYMPKTVYYTTLVKSYKNFTI